MVSPNELSDVSRTASSRSGLPALCIALFACTACAICVSRLRDVFDSSTLAAWFGGGEPPPQACTVLTPSSDAVVYWPNTLRPFPAPAPSARGAAVGALWRLELCPGVRGHEDAFEYGIPGTLALLQPPVGDLSLARVSKNGTVPACPLGACEGVVRASRLVGCPGYEGGSDLPAPLSSKGTAADSFVDAARLGPDEIDVVLEGPEFLGSIRGLHRGRCVYEFPFAATIPGLFRLLVVAIRSDWRALNESIASFPPVNFDRISGSRLLLTLGGGNATLSSALSASLHADVLARTACKQVCSSRDSTIPGRWVRRDPAVGMFDAPTPPFPSGRAFPSAKGEGFYTDLRDALVWMPLGCRATTALIDPHNVQMCMRRLGAVEFVGDSQTRVLFDHFVNRALPVHSVYTTPKDYDVRHCLWFNLSESPLGDATSIIPPGAYRVCFDWDALGKKSTQDLLAANETRAFVVNFGQHFYAESRRPVHVYAGRVRERFSAPEVVSLLALRASAVPSFRLVWVETTPFSVRNDDGVVEYGDWRTTHRHTLYNFAAERELAPLLRRSDGPPLLRTVTADDVLTPLVDTYLDAAHPSGLTAALDVVLARVIHAICE